VRTSTIIWGVVLAIALWWLWTVIAKQRQMAGSSVAAPPPAMPPAAPASAAVDYSGAFANTMGFESPT